MSTPGSLGPIGCRVSECSVLLFFFWGGVLRFRFRVFGFKGLRVSGSGVGLGSYGSGCLVQHSKSRARKTPNTTEASWLFLRKASHAHCPESSQNP